VPGDDGPPPYEVLAGLVASLRGELAQALTALEQARAELAQARERIAELEARLRQNPRNSAKPPSGEGLAGRPVTGVERRQVSGLEPVRAEVTGHQLIERQCGCGHRTKGAAPQGTGAPVQYGPRTAAVIIYLHAGQFLSKQRTALALGELFGIACSSGTVAALTARAAGRLDGFAESPGAI
jgi:transposase